jgi:hypothetical protein
MLGFGGGFNGQSREARGHLRSGPRRPARHDDLTHPASSSSSSLRAPWKFASALVTVPRGWVASIFR